MEECARLSSFGPMEEGARLSSLGPMEAGVRDPNGAGAAPLGRGRRGMRGDAEKGRAASIASATRWPRTGGGEEEGGARRQGDGWRPIRGRGGRMATSSVLR